MKRFLVFVVLAMLVGACGSSTTSGVPDGLVAEQDASTLDQPVAATDLGEPMDRGFEDPGAPEDTGPVDPGAPDLGPKDPGQPDPGPSDPGAPDLGPQDPGSPDLGPKDSGTPVDPGENLDPRVEACDYVVESLCSKVLTKCDLLGLLPKTWMDQCTTWLTTNHGTIVGACDQLSNAESTDPNVQLIQSVAPEALSQCVDNFQCTVENVTKLGTVVWPLISGGAKPDMMGIIGVVADLCFK